MSLHRRDLPGSVALIRWLELGRYAESEGRDELQRERRRVIVVDDDADIRLLCGHPLAGRLNLLEVGAPVRLVLLAVVDGSPDRGDV